MSCREFRNHRTLIVGDVNSGKTERTGKILHDLMNCGSVPIALLDLAPETVRGVGGKIHLSPAEKEGVLLYSPPIIPPRLSGKSEEEVRALARENGRRIEELLKELREKTPQTLVINDVSLYLHDRTAATLISFVEGIPTLIMNGFYGGYFGESDLTLREREQMRMLMEYCDQVFFLPARPPR